MTENFKAGDLFLPLPRPEYVALPEGFISALAWEVLEVKGLELETGSGKKVGLRYKIIGGETSSKNVEFRETAPNSKELSDLADLLEQHGLQELGSKNLLAESVLNSIRGTSAPKSKFTPASPLSPALALLQNSVGLMGKRNPPDLARIFETVYSLGRGGKPENTVASRWLAASRLRLEHDTLLRAIDESFAEVVWKGGISEVPVTPVTLDSKMPSLLTETPFGWFADAWDKITSDEWVLCLPARVWVDWATGVLRTAYAMSYLWESAWYESLGRALLLSDDPNEEFIQQVIQSMDPPLVWRGSEAPAEIRDVSSKLKWRCNKAVRIRTVLEAWVKDQDCSELPIADFVIRIRQNEKALQDLQDALTPAKESSSGSADNLWEAIRYSLKSRDRTDYYGFLENSGTRFLFPAPGIEWGAMFASLSAKRAGWETNLGEVAASLERSGTQPQIKELLALLEQTGLARGSADADLAVAVESAFKPGVGAK
jgi:hypothetical protein